MKVLLKHCAILAIIAAAVQIPAANAAKYLAEKPDFLTPCSLKDSSFGKCFKSNFEALFHEWKDGIPGLKSVGSIDPLEIKRVLIAQDPKNPVALNADLFNVIVRGTSKATVDEVNFEPKTLKQVIKLSIPKLRFDSDYKLNGRILNLALNGNGKAYFEIENIVMLLQLKLKLRDEHGFTFTDVDKLNVDVKQIGGFRVRLDNLFNGQKVLEESTNAVFNENWREFYEVLKPAVKEAIQAILKERLSKVYSYVPGNFFIDDLPSAAEYSV